MNRKDRDIYVQAQRLNDVRWNATTYEEALEIVNEVQQQLFELIGEGNE